MKLNSQLIVCNKWFENGILLIEHIFDYRRNIIYTFEQLQWLYDLSDTEYFDYITLTHCKPNERKENVNHEQMTYIQPTSPISLIYTK